MSDLGTALVYELNIGMGTQADSNVRKLSESLERNLEALAEEANRPVGETTRIVGSVLKTKQDGE